MIRLPNTGTYSLELITAQNGAQSVVSYSDATSSAYTGGTQVASITSATTTTICSTPAASTVRDVDQINIKNTYAGSHTVTVQVDANGTNYPLIVAALLTDESLNYTHGSGWCCLDANGNIKNSPLTSMTSAQLAAILTDETGSGAAVFATGPTLVAPILGTPASGTVTNLTGTASININGTVGATTPAAGAFTTLTSTGNATLGDAEATDTHAIKGATTLLANSANPAMKITQTGAGNAFVVEDSASTDSTPFVIDANGYVVSGATQAYSAGTIVGVMQSHGTSVSIGAPSAYLWTADANGPIETMSKSRGATVGTHTVVQSGDVLGQTRYFGSDGTQFIQAAQISANVDGTPGTNDMPGRLVFSTTADGASGPTERMRIASDGTTTLGGTSTAPAFKVVPVASQVNYLYTAGSATGQSVTFGALGSDTNINVSYQTKGTGGFYFGTNAGATTQVQIQHTASANRYITLTGGCSADANPLLQNARIGVNGAMQVEILNEASPTRFITLKGSNGGNPTIGTSAGSLAITPATLFGGGSGIPTYGITTVSNAVYLTATGGTNSAIINSSVGLGSHFFYGEGGTSPQVEIRTTTGATRYITLTGATGSNNPTIGVSGGNLTISTGVAFSNDCAFAGLMYIKSGTAIPAGGAQAIGVSTTSAMGVYFGSGAPTVSAAKGSLYLRSDGSGTTDRMYVNTNGTTTWTAVTTVA